MEIARGTKWIDPRWSGCNAPFVSGQMAEMVTRGHSVTSAQCPIWPMSARGQGRRGEVGHEGRSAQAAWRDVQWHLPHVPGDTQRL